jgi:MoaD family protein
MPIKVSLPPVAVIREAANGQDTVFGAGATVGSLLADIVRQYPNLEAKLFDKGQLRQHIIITVNDEDTRYLDEMETPLKEGADVVAIVPAVAGG